MLQQYLAYKRSITRAVIAAEFDHDLMQDAVAVILRRSARDPEHSRELLILWGKSQLPNPLKNNHDDFLSQVDKLHSQLLILIEDFITKATASSLPLEYLCLPHIQSTLAEGHLAFRGVKGSPRFNSANLTSSERKGFVKAFLVYEMLCQTGHLEVNHDYLEEPMITETDHQAIFCVQEYFCSLSGAIFAQCNDDWLPGTSTEALLKSQLLYPDEFCFEAEAYAPSMEDLSTRRIQNVAMGHTDRFDGIFSTLGLGRLRDFLGYNMASPDEREALRVVVREACNSDNMHVTDKVFFELMNLQDRAGGQGPESFMYEHLPVNISQQSRYKLCKQRAWVFFDDDRFYPEESTERPNFPSAQFLRDEEEKHADDINRFYNIKKKRALQWRSDKRK
ncbi:hypothetical protein ACHAPU_002022 [Fusarium lateritium]